ncbi:FecR family protein [Echinicola sp. 20G]|uniref:FecR family protein n=1 Tax=Echinicola sp. 20G TaxID=2781961 RepID=UPI00190FEF6B|nr:FecR domain-containing protein [Echinicola sp. 20G]
MNKSEFSVEDFALDPSFRKWVISANRELDAEWDAYLAKHPHKVKDVMLARRLLENMSEKTSNISLLDKNEIWENIDQEISDEDHRQRFEKAKIIPISSTSIINKHRDRSFNRSKHQWRRVAGILLICLTISILANVFQTLDDEEPIKEISYMEYSTPPGQKSTVNLSDGSEVILNSGSKIRFEKNFNSGTREIYLDGEAFFDVAKDITRPFLVHTGKTTTKALGTSFNIKSYAGETRAISLVTGRVVVSDSTSSRKVYLKSGDAVKLNQETREMSLYRFDRDLSIGWMEKKIIFKETPLLEMVRTLENWYGVEISIDHKPKTNLLVSGEFEDESLSNILNGLSYTARFSYEIKGNEIKIDFK